MHAVLGISQIDLNLLNLYNYQYLLGKGWKEVMFFGSVCLFVCMYVCLIVNNITQIDMNRLQWSFMEGSRVVQEKSN